MAKTADKFVLGVSPLTGDAFITATKMKRICTTNYCVKITIYKGAHADNVVYYRNKLPMSLIEKYRWYFEFLAAKIKVSNPRRKVMLYIGLQDLLQGREYIESKTISLIRAKRSRIKKLEKEMPLKSDLFGFESKDLQWKIDCTRTELEALERGEFNYYVPVEYINRIHEFINN